MSLDVFWYLPISGDGHYLGTNKGARAVDYPYIKQIAQAAESLGYGGILIPTGRTFEDPYIVAASLIPVTSKLKLLIALRPGLISPTVAARKAATLARLSGGRTLFNLVAGGNPAEFAAEGVFLSHDDRYRAAKEFTHVFHRLLDGETVNFAGDFIQVKDANLTLLPSNGRPPLYFGGSSELAHELAAEHVDVYLSWGETPAQVKEKIADVKTRAAKLGRKVKFGLRINIIVRETSQQAWDAANKLISHIDKATIQAALDSFAAFDSVGQSRITQLHKGDINKLEISPNLWAGLGLVRSGAGTALVGDPQTVAARINEYRDLGIDTFVLSGYPHLEEAYKVAELLFPLLDVAKTTIPTESKIAATGDFVANKFLPTNKASA